MKNTTSNDLPPKKRGRPKKATTEIPAAAAQSGNPDFNISGYTPGQISESDLKQESRPEMPPNLDEIEKKRFAPPPKPQRAAAAISEEDMAFEAAIQRMHVEQAIPAQEEGVPLKLTKEHVETNFLGDMADNYVPAASINDLEAQVFRAKSIGADSIEASEELIRYFTRGAYPEKVGYFMYKDIKVFIPGRARGYENPDFKNMYEAGY